MKRLSSVVEVCLDVYITAEADSLDIQGAFGDATSGKAI